jgi:hypothetical protein
MKIHIHLGVHKTATTFIQSQLHETRLLLQRSGIAYAGIWIVRRQFTRLFDRLAWFDPLWKWLTRPYLGRKLATILAGQPNAATFILSDENLLGLISANHWTGRLYPQAGRRVAMLEAMARDHDRHYFVAIRRYPDYLTSSWLQLASRGKAPPFEKYRARFAPRSRGWAEVIGDVVKVAGPERVTVWTYDWFCNDPASAFSLLAPGVQFASLPEEDLRRDVLPSLTIKGLQVITALEGHLSDAELKHLGRMMRTFPFDEPNPRLEIADSALLAEYEQKYQQDLVRIRALGVVLYDCEGETLPIS